MAGPRDGVRPGDGPRPAHRPDGAGPRPHRVRARPSGGAGLQYSFERETVHCDIKPSNLMIRVDGTVKVLDFGLAKMQSELCTDPVLTSTGAFLGSVDYMSPEQADDPRRADIRADIYSLGCTFHHLLSGAPPFHGTIFQILEAHRSLEPPPLNERRPEVPARLAAVVCKMMAKEPAGRFQTPEEVAGALVPFLEGEGEGTTSVGSLGAGSINRCLPGTPTARRATDRLRSR